MFCMLFFRFRINQNIINENNHETIQVRIENTIHVLHEYSWCISDTERHHRILVMSIPRSESNFLNIFFFHSYLMVTRSQINLAKHASANQSVHQIVNSRKWIPILDSYFIQLTIINTKSHATVFLLHQYLKTPVEPPTDN